MMIDILYTFDFPKSGDALNLLEGFNVLFSNMGYKTDRGDFDRPRAVREDHAERTHHLHPLSHQHMCQSVLSATCKVTFALQNATLTITLNIFFPWSTCSSLVFVH